MPIKNRKRKKKIFVGLGLGLLVVVLFLVGFFAKLYPVASVGGNFVPYGEWDQTWAAAQKLDPAATKSQVFGQFLLNQQKEQLAFRLGMVNDDSVVNELAFYKAGNESAYQKLLGDYFGRDENWFTATVVKPQVYDALLRLKYNSNFAANNDAYNKAQNILNKLALGQTFEDLAKQYSDDKVSGQLGGDVGFVTDSQVLPELKFALTSATVGEVDKNVLVSREGYHVLFPIEVATKDNQKVWHLKQILIKTDGYDSWLAEQLKTIGAHQLMKI